MYNIGIVRLSDFDSVWVYFRREIFFDWYSEAVESDTSALNTTEERKDIHIVWLLIIFSVHDVVIPEYRYSSESVEKPIFCFHESHFFELFFCWCVGHIDYFIGEEV